MLIEGSKDEARCSRHLSGRMSPALFLSPDCRIVLMTFHTQGDDRSPLLSSQSQQTDCRPDMQHHNHLQPPPHHMGGSSTKTILTQLSEPYNF